MNFIRMLMIFGFPDNVDWFDNLKGQKLIIEL